MATMKVGTEEVLKIMFGTEEVSSLAIGEETIPVDGGDDYKNPVKTNEMWYKSKSNFVLSTFRPADWFTSQSQAEQGLTQSIVSNDYYPDEGVCKIVWGLDLEVSAGSGWRNKTSLYEVFYGDAFVHEMGENFTGCTSLTAITYGQSETLTLEEGAWPPNLEVVYCRCKTEPCEGVYDSRGNYGRGVTTNGVFHYPKGKNWSTFISTLPSGWTAVDDL